MLKLQRLHRGVAVACWTGLGWLAQAATIGVYFDPNARLDQAEVAPFATFTFYVATSDLDGDLSGYEFKLLAPLQVTLLGAAPIPATSLNVGSAPANWIVGVGSCLDATQARAIVQVTGMLMADLVNVELRLGAAQPSSVGGSGPAYTICGDDETVHEFDRVASGIVNLRPESFGGVKQRYDGD
jgi:hypothetical protein